MLLYPSASSCYFPAMHRAFARLRSTIAALLVAVLVIVPVVDAFACSLESKAEHVAAAADDHSPSSPHDETGKGDAPDGSHGVCAHNHCHHSSANLAYNAAVGYDTPRVVRFSLHDTALASGLSEGLMRPPRS